MVTRRRLTKWGLLVLFGQGAGTVLAAGPDESAVYAAFLNTIVQQSDKAEEATRPVTLVMHPMSMAIERDSHMPASVDDVLTLMPGLDRLAAADLLPKLAQSAAIVLPLTMLDARLHVIQPLASDIDEIFAARKSLETRWKQFNERFPAATSLLRFSPIGYNPRLDEAVFFVNITCGVLCGSGALVRARKTATGWQVVDQQGLWVS